MIIFFSYNLAALRTFLCVHTPVCHTLFTMILSSYHQFIWKSLQSSILYCHHKNTVQPLWKGQEFLTKIGKFGPFPYIILYKSCLFYPSCQATSFERPPSWVAFIEGFHCIHVFEVLSPQFCRYLVTLFDDNNSTSTVISHRTSIASVLRYWMILPQIRMSGSFSEEYNWRDLYKAKPCHNGICILFCWLCYVRHLHLEGTIHLIQFLI